MRFCIYFFIHRVGLGTGSWSPTKTPPTTHPNGGPNNRAKDRPQYQSYLHQFRTRAGRPPSRIFIIVCSGGAPNLRIFTVSETINYTILSCQSRPKFWNIYRLLCGGRHTFEYSRCFVSRSAEVIEYLIFPRQGRPAVEYS